MEKEKLGLFQGVLSIILASLASVISKFLLDHLTPEVLVLLQETIGVIVILLLFGLSLEVKKILKFKKRTLICLAIFSVLMGAVSPFFMLKGLSITTATDAILIGSMTGVVTGLLASIFLDDKISLEKILGIIFMFIGVSVIATKGLSTGLNIGIGYYFLFGSVFSISIATIIFKKYLFHISTDIIVLSRNITGIFCMLFLFPLIVDFNYSMEFVLNDKNFLIVLVSYAVFVLLISHFLWYKSLEKIKASISSVLVFLRPLFGVIFAVIILKESLDFFHLIGAILILIGLLFSTIHKKKHNIVKDHKKHAWLPNWFHL